MSVNLPELQQSLRNSCHSMQSNATIGPDLPIGVNNMMPVVPWVASVETPLSTLRYLRSPLFLLEHIFLLPLDFTCIIHSASISNDTGFPKIRYTHKDFYAANDSDSSRTEFKYLREHHSWCCAGREGVSVLDRDSWRQKLLCDC